MELTQFWNQYLNLKILSTLTGTGIAISMLAAIILWIAYIVQLYCQPDSDKELKRLKITFNWGIGISVLVIVFIVSYTILYHNRDIFIIRTVTEHLNDDSKELIDPNKVLTRLDELISSFNNYLNKAAK